MQQTSICNILRCLLWVFFLAIPLAVHPALMAQSGVDTDARPHLGYHNDTTSDYGLPEDANAVSTEPKSPGPAVAPGLKLPSVGRLYALDNFAGKPELVHLKYTRVDLNNHSGSNFLKMQAAPFIYKVKHTLEIKGTAAAVRLHDASPVFFVRRSSVGDEESEDGSQPADGPDHLFLIRLEVKSDRRVAVTIAFTQVTGHASRSDSVVDTTAEQIPGSDWYKLTPKEPLPSGEYGWMTLPDRQNTFGTVLYDFAIDAAAPENSGALTAGPPGK